MKEYRIVKKYKKVGEFNELAFDYGIEYLGWRFSIVPPFFTKDWKPLKREICHYDFYYEEVEFNSVELCEDYIRGIHRSIPYKEVIKEIKIYV